MKVLLIGNGAREHAIAEALNRSPRRPKIFSYMTATNPGIAELSEMTELGPYDDHHAIKEFAETQKPDLAIIGPEAPLESGVVDLLEDMHVPCVGPKKHLAQLETSKGFTRNLLKKHNIPGNPRYKIFTDTEGLKEYIHELKDYVVKADGLHGGKGVKVSGDHLKTEEEGYEYAKQCLQNDGRVIVEAKLDGEEFSLMAFTDGTTIRNMPCVQDHKRAYEDDKGPNTGGMGSYSDHDHSLPFLTEEDIEQAKKINQQVNDALKKEMGEPYRGIIYGGFMVTKTGVKLIEYNARFGDPEAMNVLPILETDFVDICEAITKGTLNNLPVLFRNEATVCKYVVPKGYPDDPVKNEILEITGEPEGNSRTYFSAIDKKDGEYIMTGSRAIAVVGIADSLDSAEQLAERAIPYIQGNVYHRKDIGTQQLRQKRINHMQALR